ncbi:hypothetical protein HAV15_005031 [Penicillium sp. str. |nr:hypothetical protein HAV15_005031 [Penicillium sp. str. \
MEAIGAASAILAIATAGVQCSVKLVTFAGQVKTAPEQITMVAEDVSLNASILHQLGELATENIENEHPTLDGDSNNTTDPNVKSVPDTKTTISKQSIFNPTGLKTVIKLAKKCEEIFESLDQSLRKASQQLHAKPKISGKVKLSRAEMFKWPFLLPAMDTLRNELRNVKETLMLMLQVAMLAYSRRMMGEYGENSQRTTAIVAYSREDQEFLVRAIVAAQKAQLSSPGKEHSAASNIESGREPPLGKEHHRFSRGSGSFNHGLFATDRGLNGTTVTAQEQPPYPQCPIFRSTPPRIFSINFLSPRASITNHQINIAYDTRSINLPDSTIKSWLKEWKASFDTNVLDQLAALDTNEYEALDATRNHGEGTLEWIQFGEYRTIVEGIPHLKARTLTMVMSGIHRKHMRPKTLIEYGLPWEWDEDSDDHLIIKKWINEDFLEELVAHTRRLQESEMVTRPSSAMTELKVNDRSKDKMYPARRKPSTRRSSHFISKIRRSIPLINRRNKEQEDWEQTLDDKAEAEMKEQEFRQQLDREFGYTKEDIEAILNRKPAVVEGEKKEKKKKEERKKGERKKGEKEGTKEEVKYEKTEDWKQTREKYQFEQQTDGEDDDALSESDDAEVIIDALLAKYTM